MSGKEGNENNSHVPLLNVLEGTDDGMLCCSSSMRSCNGCPDCILTDTPSPPSFFFQHDSSARGILSTLMARFALQGR